jgi:Ala-tRNA(Pro) deacylase
MNDMKRVVTPVLDEGMLALDPLNFHPLRNDRTTAVTPGDLLKFVRAMANEPVIAKLPLRT